MIPDYPYDNHTARARTRLRAGADVFLGSMVHAEKRLRLGLQRIAKPLHWFELHPTREELVHHPQGKGQVSFPEKTRWAICSSNNPVALGPGYNYKGKRWDNVSARRIGTAHPSIPCGRSRLRYKSSHTHPSLS